jgi:hypothetical protein
MLLAHKEAFKHVNMTSDKEIPINKKSIIY